MSWWDVPKWMWAGSVGWILWMFEVGRRYSSMLDTRGRQQRVIWEAKVLLRLLVWSEILVAQRGTRIR